MANILVIGGGRLNDAMLSNDMNKCKRMCKLWIPIILALHDSRTSIIFIHTKSINNRIVNFTSFLFH